MKKFLLLTAFVSGVLAAPFFFDHEKKTQEVAHASANIFDFLSEEDLDAAFAEEEVPEEGEEKESELCSKDALFSDFSEKEKGILEGVFEKIPCELLGSLKSVALYDDADQPRALAGATSLHLRADIFDLPEAEKVLTHEFGHVVDLGGLKTKSYSEKSAFVDGSLPVFADDPSAEFYAISWRKTDGWNADTKEEDFVSRYGATDPFEDFAETFLFYVAYGETFREIAAENEKLQKKYDFLKNQVFGGEEFVGEKVTMSGERPWDATRI